MSKTIDTQVIVIGGGITGSAVTRALSKYKVDVCLIEKEAACGFGITKACQGGVHGGLAYAGSRIVKYKGPKDRLEDYIFKEEFNLKERLVNIGREEMLTLAPVLNVPIEMVGCLTLAESDAELESLRQLKRMADERGMRGISILERDELQEKEPRLHQKLTGALYDINEGVTLPTEWAIAFAENAEQNGAHIYTETEVERIEEKANYYLVQTNRGVFKARYVVNAAGLFADEIAAMVGVADFQVTGWKCQLLILENRDYVHHVIVTAGGGPQRGRLLIPTTHDSIVVAHTFEPMTHKKDNATTREKLHELMYDPPLQKTIPEISPKDIVSSFTGFLTYNTKDPDDDLLESPKRGFINAVVSAPGLASAPAMAREIVRMLGDQGLDLITKTDFNPFRLKESRFIDLPTEEKNAKIQDEPRFGHMVCRCEKVSEQEIREAVKAGARTLDEIKFRTLAGFGRCQGGFCTSRVIQIMAEELKISPLEITKKGKGSYILKRTTKLVWEDGERRAAHDHT